MEKIKRIEGRARKLPTTTPSFESLPDRCNTAINKRTLKEEAIPVGIPNEIDGRACIRFPCKDGHYKFSYTKAGMLKLKYTPLNPKSST